MSKPFTINKEWVYAPIGTNAVVSFDAGSRSGEAFSSVRMNSMNTIRSLDRNQVLALADMLKDIADNMS